MEVRGRRLGVKLPHHQCDLTSMVSGMVRQMLHYRMPVPHTQVVHVNSLAQRIVGFVVVSPRGADEKQVEGTAKQSANYANYATGNRTLTNIAENEIAQREEQEQKQAF
jgi:hypothetical protein